MIKKTQGWHSINLCLITFSLLSNISDIQSNFFSLNQILKELHMNLFVHSKPTYEQKCKFRNIFTRDSLFVHSQQTYG